MMSQSTLLDRPVLLVDDTNATRYSTRRMLTANGIDVIEAVTGEEALRLAPGCDAIVLDVNLPDLDGFEVCRRLRADPATQSLPVLHLSAQHMQDSDKIVGLEAGGDAYLTHPVGAGVLVATINALVRARKAERAQVSLRAQLASIIDSAPVAIAVFDLSGDLTLGNDAFRDYATSMSAEQRALPEFLSESFEAVRGGSRPLSGTATLERAGRDTVFMEWRIALVDEESVVVVLADRTVEHALGLERDALLERERAARTEAESAYQAKDVFLALVSHELRNPLNTISMWSSMLQRPEARPHLEQGLMAIERSAHLQARLLGDLLDVARAASGKLSVTTTPTNLTAVLRDAVASVEELAAPRRIAIDMQIDSSRAVMGDAPRLHQIAWNLLSNAIKFSEPGSVVTVGLVEHDGHAVFSVQDSGVGFEPGDAGLLFERFRQAAHSRPSSAGGLGLGLAIVRELVLLHGGTVIASSEGLGRGARFEVRIPIARSGEEQALANGEDLSSRDILLVEDDVETRRLMKLALEDHGAAVWDAGSAEVALNLLDERHFDLIVSDVGLPFMDGFALMDSVRRGEGPNRDTAAIAVTAYARDTDIARSREVGFDAHISKPVNIAGLIRRVTAVFDERDAARTASR